MNKLPDFFWADRLTPVNFYGYTSSVRDTLFEIEANTEREKEANSEMIQRFHDLKRKCMSMEVDMAFKKGEEAITNPDWRTDIWDNKIVIECKTEEGNSIFVGFYDFTYSIGLSVYSVDGRIAKPYRKED
jgi:hypothetical protein